METGEFDLIGRIKSQFRAPRGVLGIGDDCAVIPQREGLETLVSTDMLMEGVHFLLDDIPAFDLGWKSAAVNISDIAGMGGVPESTFLSFALPKNIPDSWVEGFIEGYKTLSDKYDCPLLGGDTCSSIDRVCINVTVLGSCRAGVRKLRSAALPGDLICVTGTLGDSAAGLKVILDGLRRDELAGRLIQRHYRPEPRVQEGLKLSTNPAVHAMMDISDGVGSDLRHILKASGGLSAEVDLALLPMSEDLKQICSIYGWSPVELALNGGEDYELLFTADPSIVSDLGCTVIGRVKPSQPLQNEISWKGCEKDFFGFRHF